MQQGSETDRLLQSLDSSLSTDNNNTVDSNGVVTFHLRKTEEERKEENEHGPVAWNTIPHYSTIPMTTTTPMTKDEESFDEEQVRLMDSVPPSHHDNDDVYDNDRNNTIHSQGTSSAQGRRGFRGQGQQPQGSKSSPRPRRNRRPMDHIRIENIFQPRPGSSIMLRLTCLSVLTLVILGGVGLLDFMQNKKHQPKSPTYHYVPPATATGLTNDDELFDLGDQPPGPKETATSRQIMDVDKNLLQELLDEAGVDSSPRAPQRVRYQPQLSQVNPFDFQGSALPHPFAPLISTSSDSVMTPKLGFLQMPHIFNHQLVFCSQGDVFITSVQPHLDQKLEAIPAVKLTTTVGNVLDPKIHPNGRYVAYTATYSGRRDVYLLDLQGGTPAVRLTYWPLSAGVNGLIGWMGDSALVFRAPSDRISLTDYRLYILHLGNLNKVVDSHRTVQDLDDAGTKLRNETKSPPSFGGVSVLQIDPVPLSQARDAARHDSCWFFVRYAQSSNTIRYVGGTAEQLYRYCDGAPLTDRLFQHDNYKGTSKSPQMYPGTNYLFFLSDRGKTAKGGWQPDRMNVWAAPVSSTSLPDGRKDLIQITDTTCDFEGRVIQEFSIDTATGNMIVRIGADLYWMTANDIQTKLEKAKLGRMLASKDRTASHDFPNQVNGSDTIDDDGIGIDIFVSENSTSSPEKIASTGTDGKSSTVVALGAMQDIDVSTGSLDESGDFDSVNSSKSILQEESTGSENGRNDNTSSPERIPSLDTDGEGSALLDEISRNETTTKIFYEYALPAMDARATEEEEDHISGSSLELSRLPIVVHSDFHTHYERLIPVKLLDHLTSGDLFESIVGSTHALMTLRGQLWVAPVVEDSTAKYKGAGRNIPDRRYRLAPGATMGGAVRILAVRHVPNPVEDETSDRRLAIILATDPVTQTAEHAFYLVETQPGAIPLFLDMANLPRPFLGGHVSGGSTRDGGLGSVDPLSLTVSPCGRRMGWTDRDGRIVVMNLPQYQDMSNKSVPDYVVLPPKNELGEPMVGDGVDLTFSPGGRYLAVNHNARNQFMIISIVDLGDPQGTDKVADIHVGRIVQATPSRFNCLSAFWGTTATDIHVAARESKMATVLGRDIPDDVATTLYFLSDRDIITDVKSPWGTRQPMPHFKRQKALYGLPLSPRNSTNNAEGVFSGGGASELKVAEVLGRMEVLKAILSAASKTSRRVLSEAQFAGPFGLADRAFGVRRSEDDSLDKKQQQETSNNSTNIQEDKYLRSASFLNDMDIDFGLENDKELTFARTAYRVAKVPESDYLALICQTQDDGSFVLVEDVDGKPSLVVYLADGYPSDDFSMKSFKPTLRKLAAYGLSTNRDYFYLGFSPDDQFRVVPTTSSGLTSLLLDLELDESVIAASDLYMSVWPSLEYRQLFDDAWRMLRDFFYDPDMTGVDWEGMHERYLPLVARCSKREELDDVLSQMASELSALHVFVYGGEYDSPMHGDEDLTNANTVATFAAPLKRVPEWQGYEILAIPESDPDFSIVDAKNEIYSPLSDATLRLSGQKGLKAGDVIVGVNGESVMKVPDIHMLLRGMAGNSVRLDVLRLASGNLSAVEGGGDVPVEPVIAVPLIPKEAEDLLYRAWEWKTRKLAERLAEDNGFTVGYVHLLDMSGPQAEDAFARGFFPNYDKEAFILDVRHNHGGNIDSWVLDVLQRKAWMYWQSRDFTIKNGGLGWDEQFAFRGHIVVLVDEKTSSDGEGVSRGISELGLGKLIGTRTWGGGIWLSSDNLLVDGGIASAPEVGTYNDKFGWGLGIEQMGVDPDIVVDNDPHATFEDNDAQLERAIVELKKWLDAEPVVYPKPPERKNDMTMGERECSVKGKK